jgi:hypothetical protein
MSVRSNIKQATLLLAESIKHTGTKKYPPRRTSYLFGNAEDIMSWVAPVSEEQRQELYDRWMAARRPSRTRERYSIILRNIADEVTDADLLLITGTIATPRDIYRPNDYHTGERKRYAFIDYNSPVEMLTAMKELNGCSLRGFTLRVDIPSTAFTLNPSLNKKLDEVAKKAPLWGQPVPPTPSAPLTLG